MTLALVTGEDSGIGAACAVRLARAGADIAISLHIIDGGLSLTIALGA